LPELVKKEFNSYVENVKTQVKEGRITLKSGYQENAIPIELRMSKDGCEESFMEDDSESNIKIIKKEFDKVDPKSARSVKSVKSKKNEPIKMNMEEMKEMHDEISVNPRSES